MMKTKHLFPIVLTVLALGACSDDNLAPDNGNNGASWNSEGKGYVTLSINLPAEASSSRTNETTDDGTLSEYQVNDATLILFNGDSESNAVFHSAYDLKQGFNMEDATDQITSTAQITQQINQVESGKIYALVVLNKNNLFSVTNDGRTLTFNQDQTTLKEGMTYEEFCTKTVTNLTYFTGGDTKASFLMTNAPLASKPGGNSNPSGAQIYTLAQIDSDNIHDTPEAAANDVAARIFVERAVAKVTLTSSAGGTTTGGTKLSYTINGWLLDQTNTASYLVRATTTNDGWWGYASGDTKVSTDKYRFIGNTEVDSIFISNDTPNGATDQAVYRTYWAKDPNYDVKPSESSVPSLTKITSVEDNMDNNVPQYCFENTFNVEHQNQHETTRVIVKAVFNGGDGFYTINDNEKDLIQEAAIKQKFVDAYMKEPTISTWLAANKEEGKSPAVTVTELSENKGIVTLKSVTIDGVKQQPDTDTKLDFIAKANAAIGTVKHYTGGASYYPVLIKHFGDTSTPWNSWEDPKPTSGNVYPGGDAEQNYLGRYGVLRNNWYELNVTKIAHLGSPDIPTADEKPDDVIESYISVDIRILSWTKRAQDVEL